ncbi:MAG: hypothetical protein J6B12_03300 [Clostridia bacterium]|nr:hypothetical protein [Clostridia bacterium]
METAQKEKISTVELYQEIYKGCKMGGEAIVNLRPKVTDEGLRSELTAQLERYEEFASKAREQLFDMDKSPKEENLLTKLSSKMGVMMNTMIDATSSHIAQMIIEGCSMGITDLIKAIHAHDEKDDAEKLARDVISFEESCTENMKKYL